MKGWEPIPSALISDTKLSLQTRAAYMVIRNLIWQETRAQDDVMSAEIGTLDDLARAAGCSRNSMKTYLAELREAGWISVERQRLGHPFTYTVYTTPTGPNFGLVEPEITGPESGSVQGQNLAYSRARSVSPFKQEPEVGANAPTQEHDEIEVFLEEKFGAAPPGTNAGGRRLKAIADLRALAATADSLRHAFGAADYGERRWAVKTDIALATHFPVLTRGYAPPTSGERQTSSAAQRDWVIAKASDPEFPLSDVLISIGHWGLDHIESGELFELAESTRAALDDVAADASIEEAAA